MGFCKLLGYVLIAVIAILAYFQMQCWQEDQEKAKFPKAKFNPKETNCQIEYGFPVEDSGVMIDIGIIYIFTQSMPCAMLKAMSYLLGKYLSTSIQLLNSICILILFKYFVKLHDLRQKLTIHSVEKCTKTLSRAKFFRQTTQQKYAQSTFTNA